MSALEDQQNMHDDGGAASSNPRESFEHAEYAPPRSAAPCYLPNAIAAIAASVGIMVGSAGPWASRAWVTANGATASVWWQGKTTFVLGAVAGIALFALLNLARIGSGTRWLAPLAWIASIAGLVCLLTAIVNIVNVASTSHRLVGLQVEWGLWLVAISAVVLCAMGSVAAAQVGTVTKAGMRTAIVIPVLIALGVALYFPIRWAALDPWSSRDPHLPTSPAAPLPSTQSIPPALIPNPATPAPEDGEIAEVQQLWQTSLQKHHPVRDFLAAVQAAGITGLQPALLNNGYTVCGELWNSGLDGVQAAKALQKTYPTLTLKQAAQFVLAAAEDLCPTSAYSGVYSWWQSGGGGDAGGGGAAAGGG